MAKRQNPSKPGKGRRPRSRVGGTGRKVGPGAKEAEVEQIRASNVVDAEEFERRRARDEARAALDLDPTDIAILKLVLNHPTLTQEQVGALVGLGRTAVGIRMNAAKFKRAIDEAGRSALEVFQSNQARAARVLGDLLGSPDDRIKIRAAIAHMWPHIHSDSSKGDGRNDFASFVQEAFEAAQANKAARNQEG